MQMGCRGRDRWLCAVACATNDGRFSPDIIATSAFIKNGLWTGTTVYIRDDIAKPN